MAFPTIPTVAAGRVLTSTQANTSGTRTFPSLSGLTKNSGDVLIAICVAYQSSAASGAVFSGWGAGFSEFADRGGTTSGMAIGMATRVSTGSETGTFTVTQAATITGHAAMFLLSIPGGHPLSGPVAGSSINGTTLAANIISVSPSWGALDTLWIAVAGSGETGTAGTFDGISAAPTNYTNLVFSGISGDVVGGVEAAVAFRQLNTATEDPGTFTVDLSNARNTALLIAVRPTSASVTLTHAQETNSPQALSATLLTQTYSITPATETDAVGQIVALQPLPATVTASAQPLSSPSGHAITTATTTASAQALDVDKKVTITRAAETDSIPSTSRALTLVAETDSAQPLTIQHASYTVTPVTETDLAGDIITFQPLPALTTASAQALSVTFGTGRSLTPATSTAQAQVLGVTQGGGHAIVAVTETDLANTIVSLQPLPATTTNSAQALSVTYGGRNITFVSETDSARAIAPGAGINLVEWETSAPIPYNNQVAVGDLSTARPLTFSFGVGANKTILPATETDEVAGAGTNLLPNGDFEDFPGDAHWDTFGTMSMQPHLYTAVFDPVPVLDGVALLQVEANNNLDAIVTEPDEYIVVIPSTSYTFSAWFWSSVAFNPNIAWNEYTAGGLPTAGAATGGAVPANTWTQISLTMPTSATTERLELRIYLGSGAPKEFYIDAVSLTRGTVPALTVSKRVSLTTVTTTASAQALTYQETLGITTATSTASALNLSFTQTGATTYSIDPVVSTDTAVATSIFKQIFMTLGIVTSVNTARITRAANRPSGGLALIDHEPSELTLIDHPETSDLALIDI